MAGRKHDIRLTLRQDNAMKQIEIHEFDDGVYPLSRLLGYSKNELRTLSLAKLLSDKVKQDIYEYVEFSSEGRDVADVLNSLRNFAMVSKKGEYVFLNVKALRGVVDGSVSYFPIALGVRSVNASLFKVLNQISADETVYEDIGMPDELSLVRKLNAVIEHIGTEAFQATLAVVSIDRFKEIHQVFGADASQGIMQEVSMRAHQVLRKTDIMGYLGNGKVAIILLGANKQDSNIPIARLRSFLTNKPLFLGGNYHIKATITTVLEQLAFEYDARELLSVLKGAVVMNDQGFNQSLEI